MGRYSLDMEQMTIARNAIDNVQSNLKGISNSINKAYRILGKQKYSQIEQARVSIADIGSQFDRQMNNLSDIQDCLGDVVTVTKNTADGAEKILLDMNLAERFVEEWKQEFSLESVLAGAGDVAKAYKILKDIKNGKNTKENIGKLSKFARDSLEKATNYKKISRAVGEKTATKWWIKNITGLKKIGRVSTAKRVTQRIINNLKNKTSPFNKQLKETIGNFSGKEGIRSAISEWAGVAFNGFINYQANLEEQKESGGQMSDARVMEETIVETAIDTVCDIALDAVVGAAICAVAPAASSGLVVFAATSLVTMTVNAGVKAVTGKPTTEWISDTILDGKDWLAKKISKTITGIGAGCSNAISSCTNPFIYAV